MTFGSRSSKDTSSAGFELDTFVSDLERLDRDLVRLRVQRRALPFGGPAADEVPAQHRLAGLVEEDDRPGAGIRLAVHYGLPPVPEGEVAGEAALEDDVRVLREPRELVRGGRIS